MWKNFPVMLYYCDIWLSNSYNRDWSNTKLETPNFTHLGHKIAHEFLLPHCTKQTGNLDFSTALRIKRSLNFNEQKKSKKKGQKWKKILSNSWIQFLSCFSCNSGNFSIMETSVPRYFFRIWRSSGKFCKLKDENKPFLKGETGDFGKFCKVAYL